MARKPTPLTDLIIAMCHTPALQDQFLSGQRDDALITQFGVTPDELALLRDGKLSDDQQGGGSRGGLRGRIVGDGPSESFGPTDAGGTGPVVTHWIRVAKWITTADEPDDDDGEEDDDDDNS